MTSMIWILLFASAASATVGQEPMFIYSKPKIQLEQKARQELKSAQTSMVFDMPITYNERVRHWLNYYQTSGKRHFSSWLSRTQRYIPRIQMVFKEKGIPTDLAYLAMIESGFSPFAMSPKSAVGYWQFIQPTAERYGLRVNWWLDERKDILKSTQAAADYLKDMHRMFDSWYLAAAGYNTGENRVMRLINKHGTKNFWKIVEQNGFVKETQDYIPKLIAAVLIAKAPTLYGFRDVKYKEPVDYEYFWAPGGTSIQELAKYINYPARDIRYLNPELVKGYIPDHISGHRIRIPKGSLQRVAGFFKAKL